MIVQVMTDVTMAVYTVRMIWTPLSSNLVFVLSQALPWIHVDPTEA